MKPRKEEEGVYNKHLANTEVADVFRLLFFLAGEETSLLSIISL